MGTVLVPIHLLARNSHTSSWWMQRYISGLALRFGGKLVSVISLALRITGFWFFIDVCTPLSMYVCSSGGSFPSHQAFVGWIKVTFFSK